MRESSYNYRTPASQLVEIAKIAAPFRGRPDKLNHVATEVKQIVPVLSYDAAKVIAREMDLSLTQVYNFITFYAMLSTKVHGKYYPHLQECTVSCKRCFRSDSRHRGPAWYQDG
jgi:NADH:ubiquinone oxidoreductase subunit E